MLYAFMLTAALLVIVVWSARIDQAEADAERRRLQCEIRALREQLQLAVEQRHIERARFAGVIAAIADPEERTLARLSAAKEDRR